MALQHHCSFTCACMATMANNREHSHGSSSTDSPACSAIHVLPQCRLQLSAEEVHERVLQALRLVGLEDCLERACHTLSGGQKQRVAIAGALVQNPQVSPRAQAVKALLMLSTAHVAMGISSSM